MRIVYFGSGAFGLPTLQHLSEHHDVVAVVSQPDRPAGRGGKTSPTPISEWMQRHRPDVQLLRPERIKEPEVVRDVRGIPADAWVVIAYGQKLPEQLLDGVFAINLHASLLPRWRGAAPINHAVLAGDVETGNSVITLVDRMDAGLVLGQSRRPIDPTQTAGELHDALADDGPALVEEVLAKFAEGTLEPVEQDEDLVTLATKLSKADGVLDLADDAETCRQRVHGLTPWPGVSISIGGQRTKLLRVEPADLNHQQEGGAFIDAERGIIACANGTTLALVEVQPAGKRPMAWADFVRGRTIGTGDRIET